MVMVLLTTTAAIARLFPLATIAIF